MSDPKPTHALEFTLPFVDALADALGGRSAAMHFLAHNARHIKVVPVDPRHLAGCEETT